MREFVRQFLDFNVPSTALGHVRMNRERERDHLTDEREKQTGRERERDRQRDRHREKGRKSEKE